ncbi:hypothetical protein [Neisseria flavescens]|uniref:hypothetical protein n=1 Tax=Neisseria flavescens TaxID=484 RepID=UPI00177C7273|nr:hypothetical protein [Neisseria flavescens]
MPVGSVGLAIGNGVMGARILMNRYPFRYLLSVRAFLVFELCMVTLLLFLHKSTESYG